MREFSIRSSRLSRPTNPGLPGKTVHPSPPSEYSHPRKPSHSGQAIPPGQSSFPSHTSNTWSFLADVLVKKNESHFISVFPIKFVSARYGVSVLASGC